MLDLKKNYNRDEFLLFLKGFLPDDYLVHENAQDLPLEHAKSITDAVVLSECKSLDIKIFEVEHSGSKDARVSLAREAFRIMADTLTNRALVVFKGKDGSQWRLSLMTIQLDYDESKNKIKKSFSNARRYSYMLGQEAKINTPYKYLISLGKVKDVEDLGKRFSIEVVNNEFYKEIAKLYDELVGTDKINGLLKHPDDASLQHEFAVRLIGRIIFAWFLKEKTDGTNKPLVGKTLLSRNAANEKSYYHSILAPLFFEVLNSPVNKRKNRFQSGEFAYVPYLNGGLFTPQLDDYYRYDEGLERSEIGVIEVPDVWLRKLFDLLELYNFTVDENTTVDVDLSIDPEMLGRIFENLLARINPETGETVRKSTGSFYTPREIVEYMVDESLVAHLITSTGINEEKLRALISYDLADDTRQPLGSGEHQKVVDSLSEITVLDPACGSGAFPIGILQKIVFILQQADPESKLWFEKQISGATPEVRHHLQREFDSKNFDYLRKLGVIRKSIFGIDIQPIATEIARLRCFLTLIVDERVKDDEPNRGVEPLPNLDFKFVTANTLIKVPQQKLVSGEVQGDIFEDSSNIEKLRQLREEYFYCEASERGELKAKFLQTQKDLFEGMINTGAHGQQSLALSTWDPFSHKSTEWFDPEWMFGVKEGFDIVIANPPYVRADNPDFMPQRAAIVTGGNYLTLYEKWDLFVPFIERGLGLLGKAGILTYITSNSLFTSKFAFKILDFIQDKYYTSFIDYFDDNTKVFDAGVVPVVFGISKNPISSSVHKTVHSHKFGNIIKKTKEDLIDFKARGRTAFRANNDQIHVSIPSTFLGDICYMSKGMVINSDEKKAKGEFKKNDVISKTRNAIFSKDYIEGKDLARYFVKKSHRYLEWNTERVPKKLSRPTFPELYEIPKLMRGRVTGGVYDSSGLVCNDSIILFARFIDLEKINNKSIFSSIKKNNSKLRGELNKISSNFDLKYILAIINSKFAYHFLNSIRRHRLKNYFYPDDFRKLPIAVISQEEQAKISSLVDDIQAAKGNEVVLDSIYHNIDHQIYKLYDLTPEEIQIIENSTK